MGGTLLNVQLDIGMSPLGVSPVNDPGACRCPLRNTQEQPINILMEFGKEWRKREGIAMSARGPRRSLLEARLVALPRVSNSLAAHPPARRRATRFDSPGIRSGSDWRKREGIEPSGDIAASRPDLKSGGATSAPSASVRGVRLDRRRNEMSAPRARGTGRLFLFRFLPAALPGLFLSLPAAPDFPLPFRRHFLLRRVSA